MSGDERDEPTPQPLDLAALEGIALMADHGGRGWVHRAPRKGYPQNIYRHGDSVLVATCYEGPETYPPIFCDFIEAFDPPTVLALINLARGAVPPTAAGAVEERAAEAVARVLLPDYNGVTDLIIEPDDDKSGLVRLTIKSAYGWKNTEHCARVSVANLLRAAARAAGDGGGK